jgi:3-oxoacyl-[acyl-carrier-protein] synthase-3
MTVYVTAAGAYLPGEALDNEETARRLGDTGTGAVRRRIMAANGIESRHFALDELGRVTMLNEELAAQAVTAALKDRGLSITDIGMLATGTTQADLLVPGFASMVHGRLGGKPLELLSAGGVCASSMAALAGAARAIEAGDHDRAVVVGSELVSRSLRTPSRTMDVEFLRWTLSDGAGAVVLENQPRPEGISLRLDWTHSVSHADTREVCMSAGGAPIAGSTWLDQPSPDVSLVQLRQNVSMLPDLFRTGVHEFRELVRAGRVQPQEIDHLLCHYSAERSRAEVADLLGESGLAIDPSRWFSNLRTCGNTGAASIFIMLEEALRTGRFAPGERILLAVPESGRFTFAFAHLTVVAPSGELASSLGRVWAEFEGTLRSTAIVNRIEGGTATIDDYKLLLRHLRQQVIEGGRWISRAASNFSADMFEFRSAAIKHAADEHRDFRLLERDFVACGGDLSSIQKGQKNVGSEALSAFIFQQASQPDPVDLLGAMFIIEGLGNRLALGWARQLQEQLSLSEDQVSFLRYHGVADDEHIGELQHLLSLVREEHVPRIVRTAEIVARLYALQLEEMRA